MINLFTSDRKAFFQTDQDPPMDLDTALVSLSKPFSLNGAVLFGLAEEIGSIGEGLSADIIVADIQGSPGKYQFIIERVFISGNELYTRSG
jgi:cytosine/adenosine deaminase-related metal-dependent hydrolase